MVDQGCCNLCLNHPHIIDHSHEPIALNLHDTNETRKTARHSLHALSAFSDCALRYADDATWLSAKLLSEVENGAVAIRESKCLQLMVADI